MQCEWLFCLLVKNTMHRPHRAAYLDFWSALHKAPTNKPKMEKHDIIKSLVMFSYFCCYCWDHCWVGIWYPEVYTEMVLFSGPTKVTGRKLTAVQWRKLEEIDPVGYPDFFNNGPKLPICKILSSKNFPPATSSICGKHTLNPKPLKFLARSCPILLLLDVVCRE